MGAFQIHICIKVTLWKYFYRQKLNCWLVCVCAVIHWKQWFSCLCVQILNQHRLCRQYVCIQKSVLAQLTLLLVHRCRDLSFHTTFCLSTGVWCSRSHQLHRWHFCSCQVKLEAKIESLEQLFASWQTENLMPVIVFRADLIDYGTALDLTTYLTKETEYIAWSRVSSSMAYVRDMLSSNTVLFPKFQVRSLLLLSRWIIVSSVLSLRIQRDLGFIVFHGNLNCKHCEGFISIRQSVIEDHRAIEHLVI